MSFLAPLYAIAGLAIGLPILFHLIRKQPRGNQVFSSLMFLEPSPPRLTRRSNIDQWLLLLLRATALILLAIAFSRPFWNQPLATDSNQPSNRKILLIDTSASMRRDGLWDAALNAARDQLKQSNVSDTIGLYAFDASIRSIFSMEDAAKSAPAARSEQLEAGLKSLKPTWMPTDLGLALMTASDILQGDDDTDRETIASEGEIIVITDFQTGALLDRLENYQWPVDIRVRIQKVVPLKLGNARASFQMEGASEESRRDDAKISEADTTSSERIRIRLSNDAASPQDRITLQWFDENHLPIPATETNVQVASGSTLIARMVAPPKSAQYLKLMGDDATFDNDVYVANRPARSFEVVCIDDKNRQTPENLGFFAEQVPLSSRLRRVSFVWRTPDAVEPFPEASSTPLIIASSLATERDAEELRKFMENGGHLLYAIDTSVTDPAVAGRLSSIFAKLSGEASVNIKEKKIGSYAMLERIQFQHPLFRSLSDSRFNDFTKVKIWRHRDLESLDESRWQVLARFDGGDPAFLSLSIGKGQLWVLTHGWQPSESQLALSSKFVPILAGIFQQAAPQEGRKEQWQVGDRMELQEGEILLDASGEQVDVIAKDGDKVASVRFESPGIFKVKQGDDLTSFAVNLPLSESQTSVSDIERLGRLGVNLAESQTKEDRIATQRQLRAVELESKQSWWRWLLVGVVVAVLLETLISVLKSPFSVASSA